MEIRKYAYLTVSLLMLLLLTVCGGGGGGGAEPPGTSSNWDQMVWDQDKWG